MTPDHQQIAELAERVLNHFESVRALAASIQNLGSIEQAAREAQTALDAGRKAVAETNVLAAKRLSAVQRLTTEEQALMRSIAERRTEAQMAAANWVESAKEQSRAITAEANLKAQRRLDEATADVNALTDRKNALTVEVARLESKVGTLQVQVEKLIGA